MGAWTRYKYLHEVDIMDSFLPPWFLPQPAIAVIVKIPIIVAIAEIIVFVPISFIPRIDIPSRATILAATVRASFDKEGAATKIIFVVQCPAAETTLASIARRDAPG